MVEVKTEVSVIGRCRCCLKDSNLKDLWGDHFQYGNREVYGEILSECFAFAWNPPIESDYIEQICESCIAQLRQAYNFRAEILATERYLFENCDNGNLLKCATFQKDCDGSNVDVKEEEEPLIKILVTDDPDPSYEDVEFLEEALDDSVQEQTSRRKQILKRTLEAEDQIKPKRPKKKKKGDKTRTYKNYEEETLRKCVQAVITDNMKLSEASKMYGIPLKTLKGRVKTIQGFTEPRDRTIVMQRRNVETLMRNTNVTPVQSYCAVGFECAYCGEKRHLAADLKLHTIENHAGVKGKFLEGRFLDEHCLKLDITGLRCNICDVTAYSIENIVPHLETHNLRYYKEVINHFVPLKFENGAEMKCYICERSFPAFKLLIEHMREHYKNYKCPECNATFIARHSYRSHMNRHQLGEYLCSICAKTFKTRANMRAHERMVHVHANKTYKCCVCCEKFVNIASKERHERGHKEAFATGLASVDTRCEICGKRFSSRAGLALHKRSSHDKLRDHACDSCDMKFYKASYLRKHQRKHLREAAKEK